MRVLVVDDSPLMRRHIGRILAAAGMEAAICAGGEEALTRIADFAPDVVTLDVNMPGLDGLTTLTRLMARHPCPVLMVSAYTDRGTRTTLEALARGAVDYVTKPEGTISLHVEEWGPILVDKLREVAAAHVERCAAEPAPAVGAAAKVKRPPPLPLSAGIVVIGASTGGPRALEAILPALPADFPWPVVLAQHMPPRFTRLFAERMDRLCPLPVAEVSAPTPLAAGIHVAQGERDMRVSRRGERIVAMPVPADPIYVWHPSVDALADSVQEIYPPERVVAVLLTGMGRDGAAAMTRLFRRGGRTIAEAPESAVVFGMPGELAALGGASRVLPLGRIAAQLLEWIVPGADATEVAACR